MGTLAFASNDEEEVKDEHNDRRTTAKQRSESHRTRAARDAAVPDADVGDEPNPLCRRDEYNPEDMRPGRCCESRFGCFWS